MSLCCCDTVRSIESSLKPCGHEDMWTCGRQTHQLLTVFVRLDITRLQRHFFNRSEHGRKHTPGYVGRLDLNFPFVNMFTVLLQIRTGCSLHVLSLLSVVKTELNATTPHVSRRHCGFPGVRAGVSCDRRRQEQLLLR